MVQNSQGLHKEIQYNFTKDYPILYQSMAIMEANNRTEQLKETVHHMVIACISRDTDYLLSEISNLYNWFNISDATKDEIAMVMEVSLQAAMDGHTACLALLYEYKVPMDELCPIIAAYHGKKDVISFCEKISLGNCQEAWNRFFDWMLCHGSQMDNDEDEDITLATEWVSNYNYHQANIEIQCSSN